MSQAITHVLRQCRQQAGLGVIAELKRQRAGGAELFRGRTCREIARVYQAAGARALSVVTSAWFGGSLAMLEEVAAENLGLPILRKDLIATEKAVQASRRMGASAVLLVLPLLGLDRLRDMVAAARGEGLEPFVEVATREEIEQLRRVYDGVIAISNADVKTLEMEGSDVSRSIGLIDRSDARLWVSASRIRGADDVRALAMAGFDGILIGGHLLCADDLHREQRAS